MTPTVQRPVLASVPHRQWLLALLISALGLSGCVSTQIKDSPDLANRNIGEVTAMLAEDIKPGPSGMDASENFRHWRHQFQYCRACNSQELLQGQFFGAYKAYCDAKLGTFSYQPFSKYPKSVECRSASGNLIFAVYAKIKYRPFNSLGNTAYEWFITADSFEPKASAGTANILDEFASTDDGYYKRSKEQEKAELQNRLDQARKTAEAEKAAQHRREEQAARDLPIIKTIGQKICTTVKGSQKQVMARALGKPIYDKPIERDFTVTGFTEQVAGNRVKILISGIRVTDDQGNDHAIDRLEGDVVWATGKPTWDDAAHWRPCL